MSARAETYDDDPIQRGFALDQAAQNAYEVSPDSAADAAVVHLKDLFLGVELLLDERIVDTDLAKLFARTRALSTCSCQVCGSAEARTSFSITAIFLPWFCGTEATVPSPREALCE